MTPKFVFLSITSILLFDSHFVESQEADIRTSFCGANSYVSRVEFVRENNAFANRYDVRTECRKFQPEIQAIEQCDIRLPFALEGTALFWNDYLRNCRCNEYVAGIKHYYADNYMAGSTIRRPVKMENNINARLCNYATDSRYYQLPDYGNRGCYSGVDWDCTENLDQGGTCYDSTTSVYGWTKNIFLAYDNERNVASFKNDVVNDRTIQICRYGYRLLSLQKRVLQDKRFTLDISCVALTSRPCYCLWLSQCPFKSFYGVDESWYVGGIRTSFDMTSKDIKIEQLCCHTSTVDTLSCHDENWSGDSIFHAYQSSNFVYPPLSKTTVSFVQNIQFYYDDNNLKSKIRVCSGLYTYQWCFSDPCYWCRSRAYRDGRLVGTSGYWSAQNADSSARSYLRSSIGSSSSQSDVSAWDSWSGFQPWSGSWGNNLAAPYDLIWLGSNAFSGSWASWDKWKRDNEYYNDEDDFPTNCKCSRAAPFTRYNNQRGSQHSWSSSKISQSRENDRRADGHTWTWNEQQNYYRYTDHGDFGYYKDRSSANSVSDSWRQKWKLKNSGGGNANQQNQWSSGSRGGGGGEAGHSVRVKSSKSREKQRMKAQSNENMDRNNEALKINGNSGNRPQRANERPGDRWNSRNTGGSTTQTGKSGDHLGSTEHGRSGKGPDDSSRHRGREGGVSSSRSIGEVGDRGIGSGRVNSDRSNRGGTGHQGRGDSSSLHSNDRGDSGSSAGSSGRGSHGNSGSGSIGDGGAHGDHGNVGGSGHEGRGASGRGDGGHGANSGPSSGSAGSSGGGTHGSGSGGGGGGGHGGGNGGKG